MEVFTLNQLGSFTKSLQKYSNFENNEILQKNIEKKLNELKNKTESEKQINITWSRS